MSKDKPSKPREPSSPAGKAHAPLLRRLSIEEQKALGLDTGPVLIVSTAPVAKRSASPRPSSEPLEMTQITPEEVAAAKAAN